jgi:hypothetical protein
MHSLTIHRPFRARVLLGALAFALCFPVLGAQAPQPPAAAERLPLTAQQADALLGHEWSGVYFQGKKIGFLHEAREKLTENGRTFYRVRVESQVKLVVLGQKGEIRQVQRLDFDSQPPFALVGGESLKDDGKRKQRVTLTAKGQGFEATITVNDDIQKKTLNGMDATLADQMSLAVWLKKGPAAGATLTTRDFDFEELKTTLITNKVLGRREVEVGGAKVSVVEVEKFEHQSRTTWLLRYDAQGSLVSGDMAGLVELRRESEQDAKNTVFGDDFIFQTMAKIDRPLGEPRLVKGFTLKGKGKAVGLLPSNALQSVTPMGDDVYVVKIGKHHGTKVQATPQEIAEALQETATYRITNAKVVALAKQAVGDATTDREKVARLCKFVHEYITYEIVYMPRIEDLLERKKGDCKSYSLMFTCLARAAGIPTRQAYGYFYMGDEIKGFGGHAWNEVVLDGQWVPVDATIGLADARVPFYLSVGTGATAADNQTHGKLSFQVLEVEVIQ